MAVASVLAGAVHQSLDFLPGEVPAGSACRTVKFTVVSAVFLDAGNIEGVSENRAAFAAKSILTGAATTSTSHGCCCGGFERGQVIRTVAGSRREQFCSPQDFLVDPFLCAVTVVRSRSVKLIALSECCRKSGDVPKSPLQEKWQPDAVGGHKIAG